MARPQLNTSSFLAHLFGPAKHPQPTGIRKKTLKGLKGGRKASRLAAFNRMKPTSQELLFQSGQREAYLRGETSLTDARRVLRGKAVSLGLAKPPRIPALRAGVPGVSPRRAMVEAQVARHLKSTYSDAGKRYNARTIDKNVKLLPDYVLDYVEDWDYPQLRVAASPDSPFEFQRIEDNARYNPFWYR